MKNRSAQVVAGLASLLLIALVVRLVWPYLLLRSIEQQLNRIYELHRPFPYRWIGAPYGPYSTPAKWDPASDTGVKDAAADLSKALKLLGSTPRTLQFSGRISLLKGNFNDAVLSFQRALLLDPRNPEIQLELGIGFVLHARDPRIGHCDDQQYHCLNYEFAVEHMLESSRHRPTPEAAFDVAVLFQGIPLPFKAIETWNAVVRSEPSTKWRDEAQSELNKLEGMQNAHREQIQELTISPSSYLAHKQEASKSIEIVLDTAMQQWLPRSYSPDVHQALNTLAEALEQGHNDHWLKDLLRTHWSSVVEAGLRDLSEAWNANAQGDYAHAEIVASSAARIFHQVRNSAGEARSRLEYVFALDRGSHAEKCLNNLPILLSITRKHNYIWIEGQARLEKASCEGQTRKTDVISAFNDALQFASTTKYEGLRLRALLFLTQNYVSFGDRLQIWTRGWQGLQSFWAHALPPLRGYGFYFTMASSAHSAGDYEAAIAFLQESLRVLEESQNLPLLGVLLADLGEWEQEAGLKEQAAKTFDQMAELFRDLNTTQSRNPSSEAEVVRAEADTVAGDPRLALSRLKRITEGKTFPYVALNPTLRRRLLPAYGDALRALGDFKQASDYYREAIMETDEALRTVQSSVQREFTQRELDSSWRGLTEAILKSNEEDALKHALQEWENFRGARFHKTAKVKNTPHGTIFLAYAILSSGLSAWLVDESGTIQHRWIDEKAALIAAKQFSALSAAPSFPLEIVRDAARRLHKLLIRPFDHELRSGASLVIDADGPLSGIPWAALEDEQGRALIEAFSITQVIGWTEASWQSIAKPVDISRALIIADPMLSPSLAKNYPPLVAALREAEDLHTVLQKKDNFLVGPEATSKAIYDYGPGATLIYFAGHGISRGEFGALLVAPSSEDPEGILTAPRIASLRFPAVELVVLSSCSSGAGEQTGVINLDSLVRAFLQAGAIRVIAARWDVRSETTADLMIEFDHSILSGSNPSEALRKASLKVRNNSAFSHPYYWAGFQLFGSP